MAQFEDIRSTAACVLAAQEGDRHAFEVLYARFKQAVFRTAYRVLGHQQEAEDVTQEVFVVVCKQLVKFDFRSSFKTWCYRITVNACYDRLRQRQRRYRYVDQEAELTESAETSAMPRPLTDTLRGEVRQQVERGLARLHPDLRTALILKEIEALSYQEIAEVMECSMGTVASRLARARQQMARQLREIGMDETYLN